MLSNQAKLKQKQVVYITYDGLLEPLGQSQVLNYLIEIAKNDRIRITVISYEKQKDLADKNRLNEIHQIAAQARIKWIPKPYHKSPSALATAYDIFVGWMTLGKIKLTNGIDILHARSYVAALMALPYRKLGLGYFIFDMRGFWADERVDGGIWSKSSLIYRIAKFFERQYLVSADTIVSLTEAAVQTMRSWPYLKQRSVSFRVITTCTDLVRFSPAKRRSDRFTVGYVGSADHWYLFAPAARAFKQIKLRRPNARFRIYNRDQHELIRRLMTENGFSEYDFELRSASFSEMPKLISEFDLSVYFIKPLFSKIASAPTKLGELLACGVPCLTNSGIGDSASIIQKNNIGIVLKTATDSEVDDGVIKILDLIENDPKLGGRCRTVAEEYFSLQKGAAMYLDIYSKA